MESDNSVLLSILDTHAPKQTVIFREGKHPWCSSKCHEARRSRRAAERKYRKDRDKGSPNLAHSHQIFKEAQVDAAILLNRERNKHYREKLSSITGNAKETYKVVNKLLDKEYGTNKLPNGKSDSEIANGLKDFFHSKITNIYSDIKKSADSSTPITAEEVVANSSASYFKIFTADEIAEIIGKMGVKSCESDPIPTWLLKNCLNELIPIVTLIINLSLQNGVFPDSMKCAIVRATLKKPNLDSDILNNYRPISNLSFLSKVLEKCVHQQLTNYISNSNLFAKYQSGYRKGHSCDTAVLKIQNDTLMMIDNRSHAVLMMLDLSAAFDTVNHAVLIKKLKNFYGLGGNIIKWIESYLNKRSFKVSVNDKYSESCSLEIGVPQGSILGPLLFILYTKEIEKITEKYNFHVHLYADDSQLYFSFDPKSTNDEEQLLNLKKCFAEIKSWMSKNFLKMNDDKTEILELHGLQSIAPLRKSFVLGDDLDCEVVPTLSAKNLGFYFDSQMNLNEQINKVAQKCYMNLRNIGRLGNKLSHPLKVQLVHSMVLSILDMGNASYGGITASQLNSLQKVQNAATRFVFGLYGKKRQQHISPYLKKLHFLSVYYRIRFKIAMLVFNSLNNFGPNYISNMISLRTEKPHAVRRNEDAFLLNIPPPPRYNKTNGAFSICAPVVWNALPYSIRSSNCINKFKVALKTHYFRIPFKNSDETFDDIEQLF